MVILSDGIGDSVKFYYSQLGEATVVFHITGRKEDGEKGRQVRIRGETLFFKGEGTPLFVPSPVSERVFEPPSGHSLSICRFLFTTSTYFASRPNPGGYVSAQVTSSWKVQGWTVNVVS
ncbi:hypothetical protein AVEN_24353-1 [Araneus ventricosus]|uniref:Uncharacterized protein n=1 Tax=Araneus ventricosus TaxID=182803 RepID=A0A4Y2N6C0_ARAVE|nr:hypothetical protein AVEN_24353-1 [Araneus ventricosus]